MIRLTWLAALAIAASATPAFAQDCSAQFEFLGQQANVAYNPYSPNPVAQTVQLKVKRLTRGVTSIQFLLVDLTPATGRPKVGDDGPANYDLAWIQDTSRTVFVWGAESINNTNGATVGFSGNGNSDVAVTSFQLQIPRGQTAAAGLQYENLGIRYQCFSGSQRVGSEIEQRPGSVDIALTVPRYVAAYIGGVGQTRGEISFGTLSAGTAALRKSIAVTALSTVPYDVTFDSEHLGKLKRSASDDGGIDYRMRYGGADVDPKTSVVCPTVSAVNGRTEAFDVTLDQGSISALPAGDYSDTITLTFKPRDGGPNQNCRTANG